MWVLQSLERGPKGNDWQDDSSARTRQTTAERIGKAVATILDEVGEPMHVRDMGFQREDEEHMSGYRPGVSIFHQGRDGAVIRVSKDAFGPGDLYCSVWHLFDLLPAGPGDWGPQLDYSSPND